MALTKIKGAGINISAAEKLYFDGGGTTYIQESADGVLDFYADNVKMLELLEGGTDYVWVPVDATKLAIGAGKDLNIYTSSDDAIIENITSDKDIIFKGNDGGSTITALTLDISAAGAATFNDKIIATELDISGNMDIDGTSNLDIVDIDGAVNMAADLTMGANILMADDTSIGIADDAERIEFDGAGDISVLGANLLVGHTAKVDSTEGFSGNLQVFGGAVPSMDIFCHSTTDAHCGALTFSKSSNATTGTGGTVVDNERLGKIMFGGYDGTNYQTNSVQIHAEVDDSGITTNQIGGALVFSTAAGASNDDIAEVMRITSAGKVGIGTTSPAEILHLKDNSGSTAPAVEFSNSANSRGLEIRGTFSGVVHTFKTIGSSAGFNFGTDQSGGTTYMNITNAGETTIPLQPAFLVHPASSQDNFAADSSDVTVVWGTEIFDQGGDFASNTFTAPVTGKYQLNLLLQLRGIDVAANYYLITIKTSNRNIYGIYDPENGGTDINYNTYTMSVLADMDASDTVTVTINQNGGTQQVDIHTDSYFSGFLAC